MSQIGAQRVALVLASIDAKATARASVARFLNELDGNDELILVDASGDGTAELVERSFPAVRVMRRKPGTLAPQLWSSGLQHTSAEYVAFSTAQMVPQTGWLGALRRRLDCTDAAGVGGSIAPGSGLSATDRALYLLRYASYLPPVPASGRFEPPGDNALYRREQLEGMDDLLATGFWEVEIHRRLRTRGETLACAPEAVVVYQGGAVFESAARHRLAHARQFGFGRTRGRSWGHRFARSATSPLVPPVLLNRILRSLRARGEPLEPWLPALPKLVMLLTVWAVGEASGACWGPPAQCRDAA
jgi:hypothetical protein